MFLFTHDLFCKQLSYEIQKVRNSLFALQFIIKKNILKGHANISLTH